MKKKFLVLMLALVLCLTCVFAFVSCDNDNNDLFVTVEKVSITIECKSILKNMDKVDDALIENNIIPQNGIILAEEKVDLHSNDNVLTILEKVCKKNKIALDLAIDGYVKGIAHIYPESVSEQYSGWSYLVNGDIPNVGMSQYKLTGDEKIRIVYTCTWEDWD